MLGVGIEFAFLHWVLTVRFHPLRWDRPVKWFPGLCRFGPFSFELVDVR